MTIPPLRERKEDLPSLIEFFIKKTEFEQKKKISGIDEEVMEFLRIYDYPGNIRELKNIIERMITLSRDGIVTVNDILMPIDRRQGRSNMSGIERTLKKARDNFERNFINQALANNKFNVTKTAEELKISARQLWNKISQYKIDLDHVNKTSQ